MRQMMVVVDVISRVGVARVYALGRKNGAHLEEFVVIDCNCGPVHGHLREQDGGKDDDGGRGGDRHGGAPVGEGGRSQWRPG